MNRPYVDLHGTNLIAQKRKRIGPLLETLTVLKGIVGILLDGGLSRGYADELSEIDIVIFLDDDGYAHYTGAMSPLAEGITLIDGELFDIKVLLFEAEAARDYDSVALWDLSYAEILFDPGKKLAGLIRAKLKPVDPATAAGPMFSAWWHYRLAGDIWIKRQDAAQGHYVLNLAVKPLISALFLCNGEYIPHDKWLVHMSRTLGWLPENWNLLLNGILSTGDLSLQSLSARQKQINTVWEAINRKLCRQLGIAGVDITQAASLATLEYLAANGPLPLAEWEKYHPIRALNSEPLHSLARVTGGMVALDRDKLLQLRPEEMYAWHYQVADACRKTMPE